jgi:hypothetical protein
VIGLPFDLWRPNEFKKVANELGGGVLIDVDTKSENHLELDVLRMQVGVFDRESIPNKLKMKFTDNNNKVFFHLLTIEVEGEISVEKRTLSSSSSHSSPT